MRMEDLDHPKDKPGAASAAIEDLRWLGFDWDEEYVQSERKAFYREALERLGTAVYPCICSRRDVEAAQSAPHAGEQLYYSGACRGRFVSWDAAEAAIAPRVPCWRFRVPAGTVVSFDDVFAGPFVQDVSATLGDFPVSRDRFGAGYTLAVVVDDAAMGVTEVVRGDDLLAATPSQILLQRALGLPTPAYCHVPLVVGPDGRRLAKRHGDTRVSAFRAEGWQPEEVIGLLAASCGWCAQDEGMTLEELLPVWRLESINKAPFVYVKGEKSS